MRLALKLIGVEKRHTFHGIFVRYGRKKTFKGSIKTVLLINIRNEQNKLVTKHLWFNYTNGFRKLNLQKFDEVQFNGRVREYRKGYLGNKEDVLILSILISPKMLISISPISQVNYLPIEIRYPLFYKMVQ